MIEIGTVKKPLERSRSYLIESAVVRLLVQARGGVD